MPSGPTDGAQSILPPKQSVYQQDEYDFDLQWLPKSGFLKGFWFRARYAHVDSRDGNPSGFPINDYRFIVNYVFPLL